ncbi:MAG TPA: PIG-L deacetylase family protein [Candidatus Acidoferrum sp.]|nr:PIG-L deacetylase family protein [Candidatus Acidoferrum sp.]
MKERSFDGRLRRAARAVYLAALGHVAASHRAIPSEQPAIVFAPHPDDETLGCGGTIAVKRRRGAEVTIVYMTDGAAAYGESADHERLTTIRHSEALEAAQVLGVRARDLIFLGYPDGRLGDFREQAAARVQTIIDTRRPREIFVSYGRDGHPDHEATSAIVHAALRSCTTRFEPLVYEYPVWFLHHWPLVDAPFNGRVPLLSTLRWSGDRAARILREFQASSYVGAVLDVKRSALERHRSQVAGPSSNPKWRSLADLSNGEFLELFLGDYELFHRADRPRGGVVGSSLLERGRR